MDAVDGGLHDSLLVVVRHHRRDGPRLQVGVDVLVDGALLQGLPELADLDRINLFVVGDEVLIMVGHPPGEDHGLVLVVRGAGAGRGRGLEGGRVGVLRLVKGGVVALVLHQGVGVDDVGLRGHGGRGTSGPRQGA